jgi:hypothetical protein
MLKEEGSSASRAGKNKEEGFSYRRQRRKKEKGRRL